MSYKKNDIFLAIMIMIFIISFAVVFTVFFKPLYYFDINYLNIDQISGLDVETIKENYRILINYQSIFYQGTLNLPDFIMSNSGQIHFEEVKRIFEVIQVMMIISGLISILMIIKKIKEKEYRFFRLTGLITIIVPAVLGFLVSLDFQRAFVLFHQIVFRNDYWIFDSRTDPVITILPETFFMHCFMLIIAIVLILAIICLMYYQHQLKKIVANSDL